MTLLCRLTENVSVYIVLVPDGVKKFPSSAFVAAADVLLHFGHQLPVSLAHNRHIITQCN